MNWLESARLSRTFWLGSALVLLLSGLMLAGCGGDDDKDDKPICEVSPTSLEFDSVIVGQVAERTFRVRNSGKGILTGSTSVNCEAFSLIEGGGDFSLAAGEEITVIVRFAPTTAGSRSCNVLTGLDGCASIRCTTRAVAPPSGACCNGLGECRVVPEPECVDPDQFQGIDVPCSPGTCPKPYGACCTPDAVCYQATDDDCNSPNTWSGPLTECTPTLCPRPTGACCTPLGTCSIAADSDCMLPNLWQGRDVPCQPQPCRPPDGACCDPYGNCVLRAEDGCTSPSVWQGPLTTCETDSCPPPSGACCFPDHRCIYVPRADCQTDDWRVLEPCQPNNCPEPPGVCCLANGNCTLSTESDCLSSGGSWLGQGADCTDCPEPVGACCSPSGVCSLVPLADCRPPSEWLWPTVLCPTPQCVPDPGACCHTDGSCEVVQQTTCSGDWQGLGTTCAVVECIPLGACCHQATQTCALTSAAYCDSTGGLWRGVNTNCQQPNICPPLPGACCSSTGDCTIKAEIECPSPSLWKPGLDCSPNPCSVGPCCAVDRTCTVTLEDNCLPPRTWHGPGGTCTPYFCDPRGACCAADGSCTVDVPQGGCTGDWKGEGTICTPNPCPTCLVEPASLDFGTVIIGASRDMSFTLENPGTLPLAGTIAATCDEFTLIAGGGAFNLTAGQSRIVTVRFAPAVGSLRTCTIATGLSSCGTITASGTGQEPPPNMAYVPADTLRMGQSGDPDAPPYDVPVSAFYIDVYEVTTAEYQAFIASHGYTERAYWSEAGWTWLQSLPEADRKPLGWKSGQGDSKHNDPDLFANFPVQGVSWFEADAYARFRCKRLPTEAEWELAARGGCWRIGSSELCDDADRPLYPWGNDLDGSRANYDFSGDPYESDGGTTYKKFYDGNAHEGVLTTNSPSPYGLYDVVGNVQEWTSSAESAYPYRPADGREDPPAAPHDARRVARGGSFHVALADSTDLYTSHRAFAYPDERDATSGFRCASFFAPGPCVQNGACCNNTSGACTLTTVELCGTGSTWQGVGTDCDPNPCPQRGACCNSGTGACTLVLEANCAAPNTWHGTLTSCTPNPCASGACCNSQSGACEIRIQVECTSPGVWHGDLTSCSPNPCALGSCCNSTTGACEVTMHEGCLAPNVWTAEGVCTPNPCGAAGACCNPTTGACTLLIETACEEPNRWDGGATSCTPNPCTGACCNASTGACELTLKEACSAPGIWHGELSSCSPNLCPPPGTCCNATTGLCSFTIQANCVAPNVWSEGGSCTPNPCGSPGSCCNAATGACTLVIQTACAAPNVWEGSGSCTPNPCGTPGACCNPTTGACSLVIQAACIAPNVWDGSASCNPNPCGTPGACCDPTTGNCVLVLEAACVLPLTWEGSASCSPDNPCPQPRGRAR